MNQNYKVKVLVVEDEETYREYFTDMFSDWDWQVYTASNYEDASILIKEHFFHAVTIDISLVESNPENEHGMLLLETINKYQEPTSTFIVTGHPTGSRYRRAFKDLNVIDFLEKRTLDEDELRKSLTEAYLRSSKNLSEVKKDIKAYKLFDNVNIFEFEKEVLDSQSSIYIAPLLEGLILHTYPFIISHKYTSIIKNKAIHVFETSMWSRMLGQAFTVRIGKFDQIEAEYNKLRENGVEVFRNTKDQLSGIRYQSAKYSIKDFETI